MARVLVVEDDESISALMADALRSDGFDVDTAENGAVALTKLVEAPPDLITLDLMMPVMDGWEFLRRCGDLPACAGRRILVLSAVPQPGLLGNCEFLAKPFELVELIDAVTRLSSPQ